jgi:hypothetical protein
MFAVALVMTSVLTACGDDDGTDPTSDAPTSAPTSAATREPSQPETGIDVVDRALAAVAAGDSAALTALIQPMSVACTNETGAGGPPKCFNTPGELPEGTVVEVFPYDTCEREWQFDISAFSRRFLPRLGELYAVVRIEQYTEEEPLPVTGYGVIYANKDMELRTAHAMILDHRSVIVASSLCDGAPREFFSKVPLFNGAEVILEGPAFE